MDVFFLIAVIILVSFVSLRRRHRVIRRRPRCPALRWSEVDAVCCAMVTPCYCQSRRRRASDSPRSCESRRPDQRRDGYRQNRYVADARGAVSAIGVPVFMADVKGDCRGWRRRAAACSIAERAQQLDSRSHMRRCPVVFWDVLARLVTRPGHDLGLGPLLLGRMLDLNDTQEGVLHSGVQVADDAGLLLLDPKDLRGMLQHVGDRAAELHHGLRQCLGGIDRRDPAGLLELEEQGGERFSASRCWTSTTCCRPRDGRGVVNISPPIVLAAACTRRSCSGCCGAIRACCPRSATRQAAARVLLRRSAPVVLGSPDALVERIEQVVRLIRSKGVGVYFVTQSPSDIPIP